MKTLDMIRASLTSKTILGGVALVLGFVIKDSEQLNTIVYGGAELLANALAALGAFFVWWGRITAKGPLIAAPVVESHLKAAGDPPIGTVL